MLSLIGVEEARERIRGQIYLSPLSYSETISRMTGNRVFFKLDNLQMTGSFKGTWRAQPFTYFDKRRGPQWGDRR